MPKINKTLLQNILFDTFPDLDKAQIIREVDTFIRKNPSLTFERVLQLMKDNLTPKEVPVEQEVESALKGGFIVNWSNNWR